jgi:hypothetical protein
MLELQRFMFPYHEDRFEMAKFVVSDVEHLDACITVCPLELFDVT